MNLTTCDWLVYIYGVVTMYLASGEITEQRADYIIDRAEDLAKHSDVAGLSGLLELVF